MPASREICGRFLFSVKSSFTEVNGAAIYNYGIRKISEVEILQNDAASVGTTLINNFGELKILGLTTLKK